MMGKKVCFKVCLQRPEGATREDVRSYIEDAICSWAGSLKPPDLDPEDPDGDPMFNLDRDSVTVGKL